MTGTTFMLWSTMASSIFVLATQTRDEDFRTCFWLRYESFVDVSEAMVLVIRIVFIRQDIDYYSELHKLSCRVKWLLMFVQVQRQLTTGAHAHRLQFADERDLQHEFGDTLVSLMVSKLHDYHKRALFFRWLNVELADCRGRRRKAVWRAVATTSWARCRRRSTRWRTSWRRTSRRFWNAVRIWRSSWRARPTSKRT